MPRPRLNDLPHFERLYSGWLEDGNIDSGQGCDRTCMEFKSIPGSNLPQVQICPGFKSQT